MRLGRFVQSAVIAATTLIVAVSAKASTINYNTNGSSLNCDGVAACTQLTAMSVMIGGITLTYIPESVSGLSMPSYSTLGQIQSSGAGTAASFFGVELNIDIDDTTLGVSGFLPTGTFSSGLISSNSSNLSITFSPSTVTTPTYGTLPGVVLTSVTGGDVYQIPNPTEAIEDPKDASGLTSLQGAVSVAVSAETPEPATMEMVGGLLIVLAALARKRRA